MSLEYVVVDSERNVNVPESLQKLGVQNDHDVELRRFTCPRYSSAGDDMSQMGVYINYMCADGSTGQHRCSNVEVDSTDENLMHFDWMIKRNVTLINGPVTFLVCIRKVDIDGNETDHWNSEICTDCYVSEGMECTEEIVDLHPDIIEHLLLRMNIVEAKTTDMAMQGYVQSYLDRNPDVIVDKVADVVDDSQVQGYVDAYMNNYVDVCTTTDRTLANSHAGAYELVGMDGNSEQVKTEGYQLLDHTNEYLATASIGGATVTNNGDASFTVSGNGLLTANFSKYYYYTISDSAKLFKPGKLYLKVTGDTTTNPKLYIHPQVNNTSLSTLQAGGVTEFEITQDMIDSGSFRIVAGMYGAVDSTITPGTFSVMLYQDGVGDLEIFTGGKPAPNSDYTQAIKNVGPTLKISTHAKNYFDKSTSIDGYGIATSGLPYPSADYSYSDYIKVTPGETFYMSNIKWFNGYDANKNSVLRPSVINPYTVPAGVEYLVLTYETANADIVQMEMGTEGTDIESFISSGPATISFANPPKRIGDVADRIFKNKGRWYIKREFGKTTLDAANFVEITWTEYENVTFFTLPKPTDAFVYNQYLTAESLCTAFRCDTIHPIDQLINVGNINTAASAPSLWFGFPKGTTLEEAQSIGTFDYIYRLAEPVIEELDDEAQLALDNLQVFDGVTHVIVESDAQPVVTSRYGTSAWGARAIDNTNRIEKLEELSGTGDTTHIIVGLGSGGTGAETAEDARTNLEVYSKAEVDALLGDINTVLESLIG